MRLVREWGGVTIAYRKRMVDSPAYRLNHEEVIKALEEGIGFAENLNPIEAVPDARGAVASMIFRQEGREGENSVTLQARTVLVAAGTTPNITYEKEAPGSFQLDSRKKFFQPHAAAPNGEGTFHVVPDPQGFFTSYQSGGKLVTYYGDNHPRYAGNVVKAMASAKHGFPRIVELFARELSQLDPAAQPARDRAWRDLVARMTRELSATVEDVVRLTPTIVEVIVKAPAAARHFQPGQFYRLQNYESVTDRVNRVPLLMEGIALTGAWVDKDKGLLSLIALELGVSSRLVAYLRKGDPVVVMGPTGTPTEIPENSHVLLLGGGLGNAVLFSIAKAMQERGNTVIYFAGYKKGEDLFKREEIEAATDQVVWSTDMGAVIAPGRPAGLTLPREHRPGDAGVSGGRARSARRAARKSRSHHRDRLRPHDGGRQSGAPRCAGAASAPGSYEHRQHQLAHAVHDERSLRTVPAEAHRSGLREGNDHLLLLQSGSGHGPRGLPEPRGQTSSEHGAGEAVEHVARPSARGTGAASRLTGFGFWRRRV